MKVVQNQKIRLKPMWPLGSKIFSEIVWARL